MNPFRFDGRDGARYDASTGLDWMRVRAYDPSVGRFLSRDLLGRAPLFFADNPYVYAGNNPLSNVDPSGQYRAAGFGSKVHESWAATKKMMARVVTQQGSPSTTAETCNPYSSSHSAACGNWAWNASQYRDHQLGSLQALGYGLAFGGAALSLAADIAEIAVETGVEKAIGVLDLLWTLTGTALPLAAGFLEASGRCNGCEAGVTSFVSTVGGFFAVIHGLIAAYQGLDAWVQVGINFAVEGMLLALAPELSWVQWVFAFAKLAIPGLVSLVNAGGLASLSLGYADLASYQRQNQMSIVTWCAQYGGGDCGSPIPAN